MADEQNNQSDITGEPMIGQVVLMATDFVPVNWVACDGRLLNKGQYAALFSLIGNAFGGDGKTTFAVPDLRATVPTHGPTKLGEGQKSAATDPHDHPAALLLTGSLPPHGHTAPPIIVTPIDVDVTLPLNVRTKAGQNNPEGGGFLGIGGKDGAAATIYVSPEDTSSKVTLDGGVTALTFTPEGSIDVDPYVKAKPADKDPFSVQQALVIPFIRMTWCICVDGVYPELQS